MARITVEDCIIHIENHFELINTAAIRATKLARYAVEPLVLCGKDKATVVALREIAAGYKFDQNGEVTIEEVENETKKPKKIA